MDSEPHSHSDEDLPSHHQDRLRARWTPTYEKFFVQLMLEQVQLGNNTEGGFRKEAWMYMHDEFNNKFGTQFSIQHLKNRLKMFKSQIRNMRDLLSKDGFHWDGQRCVVVADDEVWDEYISENPRAWIYRAKRLPLYEDVCSILDKFSAYGREFGSSSSSRVHKNEDEVYGQIAGIESPLSIELPIQNKRIRRQSARLEQKRNHSKVPSSSPLLIEKMKTDDGNLAEVIKILAEATRMNSIPKQEEKSRLEKCIEELQMIEGLDMGIMLEALELFRDETNSTIFLTLRGDLRVEWLKKMCLK